MEEAGGGTRSGATARSEARRLAGCWWWWFLGAAGGGRQGLILGSEYSGYGGGGTSCTAAGWGAKGVQEWWVWRREEPRYPVREFRWPPIGAMRVEGEKKGERSVPAWKSGRRGPDWRGGDPAESPPLVRGRDDKRDARGPGVWVDELKGQARLGCLMIDPMSNGERAREGGERSVRIFRGPALDK